MEVCFEQYLSKFRVMIKDLGLNNSIQKEHVLKLLFDSNDHLSADDIQYSIKKNYKINIGIATVYRILNLFEELNIVNAINIEGNTGKIYELNLKAHHDHIVCISCGKIVEFVDDDIESMQLKIAKENGFILKSHNMLMYGICDSCSKKSDKE